jgi:hypothetical protein
LDGWERAGDYKEFSDFPTLAHLLDPVEFGGRASLGPHPPKAILRSVISSVISFLLSIDHLSSVAYAVEE